VACETSTTLFGLPQTTSVSLGTDRLLLFTASTNEGILVSDFITQIGVSPVAVASVSTTQALTTDDRYFLADASGGSITLTLPAASGNSGYACTIKKVDSTASVVTIDGSGAETMDGELTQEIDVQYTSISLVCDGSNWFIL